MIYHSEMRDTNIPVRDGPCREVRTIIIVKFLLHFS